MGEVAQGRNGQEGTMSSSTTAAGLRQVDEALAEAATAASFAPSIHNTQPWHWRIRPGALELWAVNERQLAATDPEGRMMLVSCGAALHHARVALAAQGYETTVLRMPDPTHPDHLAHLTVGGHGPVTAASMRMYQAIALRHTDRRPVTDQPVPPDALLGIVNAVQEHDSHLHILRRDQVIELASAASYAQSTENRDERLRAELAYWTGGVRPDGSGVPAEAIPDRVPQTTVPGRDFGQLGALPISAAHDTAASYAILYGAEDTPVTWLRCGEALSAGWLAATELGVSVLPLSAVVEVPATRQTLRHMLFGIGHPNLVLRFGNADPEHRGPRPTPRLPSAQTIETVGE
jgi:nitroreductase